LFSWDVSRFLGKTVAVTIVDRKQRGRAHITFDDFSVEAKLVKPVNR
jgi:hypothetical protein